MSLKLRCLAPTLGICNYAFEKSDLKAVRNMPNMLFRLRARLQNSNEAKLSLQVAEHEIEKHDFVCTNFCFRQMGEKQKNKQKCFRKFWNEP